MNRTRFRYNRIGNRCDYGRDLLPVSNFEKCGFGYRDVSRTLAIASLYCAASTTSTVLIGVFVDYIISYIDLYIRIFEETTVNK